MDTELIIAIVGIVGTLLGTGLGAFASNKGQEKLYKLQLSNDYKNYRINIMKQRMEIYSQFKFINGSIEIVNPAPDAAFNIELYKEKIRPIFNAKFYILPKQLKTHLINIDEEISFMNHFLEPSHYDKDILTENYNEIYQIINAELLMYNALEISSVETQ